MKFYSAQEIYRKIESPSLRLAAVKTVRALRTRYLLLRVDTNDACNLRCVMCNFSDPKRRPAATPMSEESFGRLAEQFFDKARYLYLSCGAEPFVTANFDKLLDIAGAYDVPFTSYCTNALLMKDKFIDATLRNRVSEVIISVDGATAETYEVIRVGGRWAILGERLTAFSEAKRLHDGPVPVTRFNFTVQEGNRHELHAFVDWVAQWRPATVQFRLFRSLPGAIKQHDDNATLDALKSALPSLRKKAEAAGFRLLTTDMPEDRTKRLGADASPFSGGLEAVDPASLDHVNCQLPWFNLYVTTNGNVRPCTVHQPVGNFMTQTFDEIENGAPMQSLRKSLTNTPDLICKRCQLTGESGA